MSFIYLSDSEKKYSLSYSDLRDQYRKYRDCSDAEFVQDHARVLHTACIICWLKEYGQHSVSDEGIVHEIAHWMQSDVDVDLSAIREKFNVQCELS